MVDGEVLKGENRWRGDVRSVVETEETMSRGQINFAHVVSTNYSQYHIWLYQESVHNVKHAQKQGH